MENQEELLKITSERLNRAFINMHQFYNLHTANKHAIDQLVQISYTTDSA